MDLTAVFKEAPEGFIAWLEELPGANAQGATLEEARANLQEAVQVVMEANRLLAGEELEANAAPPTPFEHSARPNPANPPPASTPLDTAHPRCHRSKLP